MQNRTRLCHLLVISSAQNAATTEDPPGDVKWVCLNYRSPWWEVYIANSRRPPHLHTNVRLASQVFDLAVFVNSCWTWTKFVYTSSFMYTTFSALNPTSKPPLYSIRADASLWLFCSFFIWVRAHCYFLSDKRQETSNLASSKMCNASW